jgi:uncharacterized protein (TIGR02646 family)
MIALNRPQCPNPDALKKGNYKHPVNKVALGNSTHQKCMYCESKIGHTDYAHVEHIKPKTKYPDLEFAWDNLGYSCAICNVNKGEKYDETLPFINPYTEDPEKHITFAGYYAMQDSRRGKHTIDELKLNRAELLEERKETIEKIVMLIKALNFVQSENLKQKAVERICNEAANDKRYSSAVKCFLKTKNIFGAAL